ncbi:hypothetical protein FJZ19_03920 [Candidatus Pacearchaeota archaeon]|nr:hypothetical protein [Candidatus Pacearchaeota archaeon]
MTEWVYYAHIGEDGKPDALQADDAADNALAGMLIAQGYIRVTDERATEINKQLGLEVKV